MTTTTDLHTAAAALGRKGGLSTSAAKQSAAKRNASKPPKPGKLQRGRPAMSSLIRVQIRDASNSDTYRAVKIYRDGEVEVKKDFGTIGEAARAMLDDGIRVKIFYGKREITRNYAESGEIG